MSLEEKSKKLLITLQSEERWWCEYLKSWYTFGTAIKKTPLPVEYLEGTTQKKGEEVKPTEYRVYIKEEYQTIYLHLEGLPIIFEGIVPEDESLVFKFINSHDIILVKPENKIIS